MFSRRGFLKSSAISAGMLGAVKSGISMPNVSMPLGTIPAQGNAHATDEAYWQQVAAQYPTTDAVINLENGYWGIMAAPVLKTFQHWSEKINHDNTYYARLSYGKDISAVVGRVADFLAVEAEELALTRNATEALQTLIGGYNQLKQGDAVLYADLDYPAMKSAMQWLEDRRGVKAIKIDLPEPASKAAFLEAYESAFKANPAIKLCLLTHVNNHTGLIHPVKDIAALARARGIDCILDAAHSIGQVDYDVRDLGIDFIGFNLHKWMGAPIGCGLMYIKKERLPHIDPHYGEPDHGTITSRIHTGTMNFAATLSIPAAIDFHESIGGSLRKQQRLKYLRDVWAKEARKMEHIEVLTPDDANMAAALTSFRVKGRYTTAENNAIAKRLLDDHGILTVRRTSPARGDCIRVTPSIYNSPADSMALVRALESLA